ncbi:ROK family protein, partial [bacterium]|nr:ROK family protein [candidate division CSSED10-310 bacterium]
PGDAALSISIAGCCVPMRSLIAAVDMGATNLRVALVTAQGRVVEKHITKTEPGIDGGELTGMLLDIVSRWLASGHDVAAVGIAAPGPLDMRRGIILAPPNLPRLRDYPVVERLSGVLGIPVALINDADAAALGEGWLGAARGFGSYLVVTVGTGIGSGLILDGKLAAGADGVGAEFGHMCIDRAGPLCSCGNRGCIEAYASSRAMVKSAGAIVGNTGQDAPERLAAAATAGDLRAAAIFETAGRAIGIGLYNVARLLDVRLAVIAGGLSGAGEVLLAPIRDELAGRNHHGWRRLNVVRAELDEPGLSGAVRLCMERLV